MGINEGVAAMLPFVSECSSAHNLLKSSLIWDTTWSPISINQTITYISKLLRYAYKSTYSSDIVSLYTASHLVSICSNLVWTPDPICPYKVVILDLLTLNWASVSLWLSTKICKNSFDIVIIPIAKAVIDRWVGSEGMPTGSEVEVKVDEEGNSVPSHWVLKFGSSLYSAILISALIPTSPPCVSPDSMEIDGPSV